MMKFVESNTTISDNFSVDQIIVIIFFFFENRTCCTSSKHFHEKELIKIKIATSARKIMKMKLQTKEHETGRTQMYVNEYRWDLILHLYISFLQ